MAKTGRRVREELAKKADNRKGNVVRRPPKDDEDEGASPKVKLRKK